MTRFLFLLSFCCLSIACGADSFGLSKTIVKPDATGAVDSDDPPDVAADGSAGDTNTADIQLDAADAADTCATSTGGAACDSVMDAFCARHIQCNPGGFQSVAACRMWFKVNAPAYDCSTSKFNKIVCTDNACAADMPGAQCNVVNYPEKVSANCGKFFGQF